MLLTKNKKSNQIDKLLYKGASCPSKPGFQYNKQTKTYNCMQVVYLLDHWIRGWRWWWGAYSGP